MIDVCDYDCENCKFSDCVNDSTKSPYEKEPTQKKKYYYPEYHSRIVQESQRRNMETYAETGAVLREYREWLGYTETQVAKDAGCHLNTIYALETGRLRITERMLDRLEVALPGVGAWLVSRGVLTK